MQLRDLRELADRRGFEIVGEYCDEGVSGAKNSRPGLDRLLSDAEMGKFSIILVWKLDRLGRSLVHLVRLMEDFRRLSIELVSFSEALDFTTMTGKLLGGAKLRTSSLISSGRKVSLPVCLPEPQLVLCR